MGQFTRQEFIRGCQVFGAQSVSDLKKHVSEMREQLCPTHPLAKRVYMYAFVLTLEEGKKQLPREMATEMWKILLPLYDSSFSADDLEFNEESGMAVQSQINPNSN